MSKEHELIRIMAENQMFMLRWWRGMRPEAKVMAERLWRAMALAGYTNSVLPPDPDDLRHGQQLDEVDEDGD